jgi:hypothetical protein
VLSDVDFSLCEFVFSYFVVEIYIFTVTDCFQHQNVDVLCRGAPGPAWGGEARSEPPLWG